MKKWDLIKGIFTVSNFYGILLYRLSHYFYLKGFKTLPQVLRGVVKVLWSMDISPMAHIGKGFRIVHTQGVIIGDGASIGDYVEVFQNTTIGGRNGGMPSIGDYVTIFTGACVLGDIHIGNCTEIGANAVVLKSTVGIFPILVGIPAVEKNRGRLLPHSVTSMKYRKDYLEVEKEWLDRFGK